MRNLIVNSSRVAIIWAIGIALILGIMFYKLGSLTPGLGPSEIETYTNSSSLSAIANNIVNAPYKLSVLVSTKIFNGPFGLRLTGALIGSASIVLFYLIARRIFIGIVAIATTILYASSTLLLSLSRTATPGIMLLSLLALVTVGFFIRYEKKPNISWLTASALLALSLYVPGILPFIVLGLIWQFKNIKKSFEKLNNATIIFCSVIFGILLVPLLVGIAKDTSILQELLGYNELNQFSKRVAVAAASLFAVSPKNPELWLGRQPILDVFASVMFIYGIFVLITKRRLDRFWAILGIFVLTFLWIGITGNFYGLLLALPFVYLVIGSGLQSLIDKWFSVFPKNPIARYLGLILLTAAVITAANFQAYRYFVAWSHSDETEQVFTHHIVR